MDNLPDPEQTGREDVASRPVRLADGRDWGFARPSRRLIPSVVEGVDVLGRRTESIAVRPGFGYPLEIQRLVDGFRASCDEGSTAERYRAFFALAIALLCRAHEIDRSTACVLLTVDDAELPRVIAEVLAVAFETPPETSLRPEEGQTDG
jgi:hypothetical protein